ncbi:DDE-type integrase/transposase/recombinase [Pandoraea pnomenusa]|uniref:DDE-type integrase/transposase/recombinase n=1 Tax=Pandoraea pnomenusa TaxID=93220 RepID=UPI001E4E6D5C|nr:DDE-type integrase/transposase/recombinase [Pandoraea pnomenusa]
MPNERWSTDLCRVWSRRDGWTTLALVIDCHTRELLGWRLSRSGKACTAVSARDDALIARFGTLGPVSNFVFKAYDAPKENVCLANRKPRWQSCRQFPPSCLSSSAMVR